MTSPAPKVLAPPSGLTQWMRWVEQTLRKTNVTGAKVAVTAGGIAPGSIGAGAYAPGSLDTFVITSGVFQSSPAGSGVPRWEGSDDGIIFQDDQGNTTIEFDTASGNAIITGEVQTALPGIYPRAVFTTTTDFYNVLVLV